MRPQSILVLLAVLSLPWIAQGQAAPARPAATVTLAQAESLVSELKQGMSLDQVFNLLGKPRRTALRNDGGSTSPASQGSLQWSYTWSGPAGQGSLNVEFGSSVRDAWQVRSWEWATY